MVNNTIVSESAYCGKLEIAGFSVGSDLII